MYRRMRADTNTSIYILIVDRIQNDMFTSKHIFICIYRIAVHIITNGILASTIIIYYIFYIYYR